MTSTHISRYGSGREVQRIEDAALLRGAGRFTDDVAPAGQLVMRFLRSDHARGRIVSIDVTAARRVPGVVAVYTGADLEAAGVQRVFAWPLADELEQLERLRAAVPLSPSEHLLVWVRR